MIGRRYICSTGRRALLLLLLELRAFQLCFKYREDLDCRHFKSNPFGRRTCLIYHSQILQTCSINNRIVRSFKVRKKNNNVTSCKVRVHFF